MTRLTQSTASAPASVGNVGVGFDVLGHAFDAARDRVTVRRTANTGSIQLGSVSGLVSHLPSRISGNCALAAAQAVLRATQADCGLIVEIDKGVPLSAGMGGSAASAVAAAGAVNALLGSPLDNTGLLAAAMEGERVSADPPPWDNVMAALHGGLVLAARLDPALIRPLPVPSDISCVLFHPDRTIETQAARNLLTDHVPLQTAVEHARHLASFIAGCTLDDTALIEAGLRDILIEPQRQPLLPELAGIQAAALNAGALGCSFSGSGPSIFAWTHHDDKDAVTSAMANSLHEAGIHARHYEAPLDSPGLLIEDCQ